MFGIPEAVIIISIASMVIAQIAKFFVDVIVNKRVDETILISTGGMPSSHSALVTALTVSIGLFDYHLTGSFSLAFAVSIVVSLVVVHDSMGVRYEASKHARELNLIKLRLNLIENIDVEEKKLKEALGHKPREVLVGVILGSVIAIVGFLMFR